MAAGRRCEVDVLCVHRATGAHIDTNKRNLWTMEGGWPARLDEHYDVGRVAAFLEVAFVEVVPGLSHQAFGNSRTTSVAFLSVRKPRNTG